MEFSDFIPLRKANFLMAGWDTRKCLENKIRAASVRNSAIMGELMTIICHYNASSTLTEASHRSYWWHTRPAMQCCTWDVLAKGFFDSV